MQMTDIHCTTVRDMRAECTCGWQSPCVFDPELNARWHRLAVGERIDNPYLHAFLAPITKGEIEDLGGHGSEFLASSMRRDRLVAEYAWAIPTENVVRKLAELSPICDLGCGTGYWASLLRSVGADVIAVDAHPPRDADNHWHRHVAGRTRQPVILRHFVDIVRGDAETFDVPINHALMLCWPPYNDTMAERALDRYRGDRVIYIGEGAWGCTATDAFHDRLAEDWDPVALYKIPQWHGLHDNVRVYTRRKIPT